jgi:hypothetical protein
MQLLSSFYNLLSYFVLVTTIGFSKSLNFGFFLSVRIIRDATIRSVVAVKVKKIHWITPKEMRILLPVPSVVCVLAIKTMRFCMIHPMDENIRLLKGSEKSCLFQSLLQPFIVFTAKIILHWDMTKKDQCQ